MQLLKATTTIVLGVVLPAILLTLAYQAVGRLDEQLVPGADLAATTQLLPSAVSDFNSANDYAFASIALLESGNQRVMLNKHRIKVAVMNIGFAVSCVGLLLMVLGIDAGGIEFEGSAKDSVSVNLKIASSGVAVFVLGAAMAAGAGLLNNKYTTLGVPGYVAEEAHQQSPRASLASLVKACEAGAASPDDIRRCVDGAKQMAEAKE